jgi:hypothetical protein
MNRQGKAGLIVAVGMTATLVGLYPIADRPAKYAADETWSDRVITTPVEPNEDEPGWNCYTMGNGSCGTLTYVEDPADRDRLGAILPKAIDGQVYVSWPDGAVTLATRLQRELGWVTCVETADGGDASLFACDEAWQVAGDRFDMRTR